MKSLIKKLFSCIESGDQYQNEKIIATIITEHHKKIQSTIKFENEGKFKFFTHNPKAVKISQNLYDKPGFRSWCRTHQLNIVTNKELNGLVFRHIIFHDDKIRNLFVLRWS